MTASFEAAGFAVMGGGGHARSVVDVARRVGWRVQLVISPDGALPGVDLLRDDREGLSVAARVGLGVVLGVGDNRLRARLADLTQELGASLLAVTAVTASCSNSATVAAGAVVMEHAHVGPGASVGTATIINTGAVVEHDVQVGRATHVAPGAVLGGGVRIGEGVLIGAAATVLPDVSVGDGAVVGAGALVRQDVDPGRVVVGVPAAISEASG